jgi:hypothetical protein
MVSVLDQGRGGRKRRKQESTTIVDTALYLAFCTPDTAFIKMYNMYVF